LIKAFENNVSLSDVDRQIVLQLRSSCHDLRLCPRHDGRWKT